jgi:hypothetical protein
LKASFWQHLPFHVGLSIVTKQKKPALWEVMADAYYNANNMPTSRLRGGPVRTGMMRSGIAAELRALADEVAPEEPEPPVEMWDEPMDFAPWYRWSERQRTRALLLQAAAEAEGKADG